MLTKNKYINICNIINIYERKDNDNNVQVNEKKKIRKFKLIKIKLLKQAGHLEPKTLQNLIPKKSPKKSKNKKSKKGNLEYKFHFQEILNINATRFKINAQNFQKVNILSNAYLKTQK